jgi:hypothetical protein
MSVLGKYIPHPPAGSGSWGDAGEPLDAGRWTVLRQNAVFLAQQNASRHIASHEGFRDFWRRGPLWSPPRPLEFQHINRSFTRKTGGAWLDFGAHWFHRVPLAESVTGALAPFGVLTLRARWKVEGGHTVGAVLAVSPGNDGAESARTSDEAWERTTSSSWADLTLSLSLTENLLRDVLLTPAAGVNGETTDYQRGSVRMGRIWFGAYNSSNTNTSGNRASIVNISLHLSAAP